MRRYVTALCATSTLLLPLAASGERPGRSEEGLEVAIQPLESRSGLVLLSSLGRARVETRGTSARVELGPREELTTIGETRAGWVAAGVRQDDEGSAVFLLSADAAAPVRLPALGRRQALQLRPVLLVLDGDLLGAAWLEGRDPRSLSVRFADWTGLDWGRPRTVAGPGPGSQTGLTGAALEDGTLLLAWSRFDGADDEVYWSQRSGSSWSRPTRLGAGNSTPDVTPVLAASEGGAILVWSRLEDAQYRLLICRFDSGGWSPERRVGGSGSMFPTLIRRDRRLFALSRTAAPRGWSVTELGRDSPGARHAFFEQDSGTRPILEPSDAGARIRWGRSGGSSSLPWEFRQP